MHTFYFAHDSSWAVILILAASRYDWNWFLVGAAIALLVWTLFEVYNLLMAVKLEREEIFAPYLGPAVGSRQAVIAIVVQIAVFYGLVNTVILFMGEGSFLQWAAATNMVMAAGPGTVWLRRGSRDGNGPGIALVILLGTINTFLPTSMFVLALPQVFNAPWFYLTGAIFTTVAAANLVMVARFPPKTHVAGQARPIW